MHELNGVGVKTMSRTVSVVAMRSVDGIVTVLCHMRVGIVKRVEIGGNDQKHLCSIGGMIGD